MERKVTIQMTEKVLKKEPKFTQDGKRIIENWCLYAEHLIKKERLKARKLPIVSKITENDKKTFKAAYMKLKQQQAKSEEERRRQTERLAKTRSTNNSLKSENRSKKLDDDFVYCKIDYKANIKQEARREVEKANVNKANIKREVEKANANSIETPSTKPTLKIKPVVKIPPLKRKKWTPPSPPKRKPRPVVAIPPVKTRPWVPPCLKPPSPKVKPVIEYPPLKMRKIPSKSALQKPKPKVIKIKLPPIRVRPQQSCSQIQDKAFCKSLKRVDLLLNQLERAQNEKPMESGDHLSPQRSNVEGETLSSYPEFNLFISNNDVRSIRGTEVKTLEMTQENVPMGICYAVASLCISQSLDSEFYTRDIIDKIIVLGNDLIKNCADACISDFNLCQQSICPEEINWNFELNNVFTNVQMDIFQKGIITTHPGPPPHLMHSLDEFFAFYSVGVLVTHSFVVAVWRDNGEFFIFYSHPIDEDGKISASLESNSTKTNFPGLVVFKSVSDLYKNIIGNIPESAYCKPYELRICIITMTDLFEEPDYPCVRGAESLLDVEWVLPAVAVPDFCSNIGNEEPAKEEKQISKELMRKIKSKSSTATGFIKFSNGGLLCGRISKQSKSLNLHHVTKEFHANAIGLASVAISSVQELNYWCGEVIDSVIKLGNNLYIESAVVHNSTQVSLKNLITSMTFEGTQVNMTIEFFRNISKENLEMEFLLSTFDELFCCYSNAILCRGKECWTLFNRCEDFFIFDPLGIEVKGKKTSRRRAVLYKFESLDLMIKQLMNIFEEAFEDDCNETCEISAILSCPTRIQQNTVSNEQPCPKKKPVKSWKNDNKIQGITRLNDIEPICEEIGRESRDCIETDLCAN